MGRPDIDDETCSVAVGPMQFDVQMAREHGWTERHIASVWERLRAIVSAAGGRVVRQRPDLWKKGPIQGMHTFVGDGYVMPRKTGKPDRRAAERRAAKRRTGDKLASKLAAQDKARSKRT